GHRPDSGSGPDPRRLPPVRRRGHPSAALHQARACAGLRHPPDRAPAGAVVGPGPRQRRGQAPGTGACRAPGRTHRPDAGDATDPAGPGPPVPWRRPARLPDPGRPRRRQRRGCSLERDVVVAEAVVEAAFCRRLGRLRRGVALLATAAVLAARCGAALRTLTAAFATAAATQHLHLVGDDVGAVALLAVLPGVLVVADLAFDIHLRALA